MQVRSCQRRWTVRMGTRGSSPRNYKQNRVTSPTGKRRERTVDHTKAGSMVVTESEWTYSHRHSTVVAIHRWSNGRTDRQSGRGVTELQTWRELRLVVGQCLRIECQGEPLSAISSISFERRNSCCFENSLHNKIAFLTRWKKWNIKPNNVLLEVPMMFNSVILEASKPHKSLTRK